MIPQSRCGIFALLLLLPLWAISEEDSSKLAEIKYQIQSLKTDLGKTTQRQSHLEENLKETELRIEKLNRRLLLNATFQSKQQKILDQLKIEQRQYEKALSVQSALLAEEMVSAYKLGQADYVKVLLSQENPEMLDRMLMYHGYFSRNREKVIVEHQTQLAHLEENKARIDYVRHKLDEVSQKLIQERMDLQKALLHRQFILKKISHHIDHQSSQLQRLLDDQEALEGVIHHVMVEKESWVSTEAPSHLKNRLPWPVRGKIIARFGSQIEHSMMKSNGVVIAATQGQPVHAIAAGRIVFSKWLRGYGLLAIVDHGKGFMSLYGHNNRLYKNEGDPVKAGEAISEVGQISGYDESGLYFEVRQNGVALDPARWCQ